jgi:hypothetical protein
MFSFIIAGKEMNGTDFVKEIKKVYNINEIPLIEKLLTTYLVSINVRRDGKITAKISHQPLNN